MDNQVLIEAFKAEHPDAFQAIHDQGHAAGFNAGQVKGNDEGIAMERDRFKALTEKWPDRPQFVGDQYAKGHDLGKAGADLADVLVAENATLRQAQAAAIAESQRRATLAGAAHEQTLGQAALDVPPAESPASGASTAGNARLKFNARKAEIEKQPGMTPAKAVNQIAREDPALYEAFMSAANAR